MSIFRESFKTKISGSLAARQKAMTDRTPSTIQYLNSRNSWIRMTSSVNVGGSNVLAGRNVLLGGTTQPFGLKSGVGSTLNKAYSTKSTSGVDNRLGLRPMAGIVNMNIKSKSAYGSLREAVVNFQCWDIHQLEELELLYMRPGYTVLVEWGWTPYLDNSGNLVTTLPPFYDILSRKSTDRTKIFKELYEASRDSGGNYDAMFGYVKNYQWSARPDGGYDCQTTIISTGEIIESLKVNYVLPDLTKLNNTTSLGDGFLNAEFALQGTAPPNRFKEHYEKNILAGVWAEAYFKLKDATAKTIKPLGGGVATTTPATATLSSNSIFKDNIGVVFGTPISEEKFHFVNAPYLYYNWSPLGQSTTSQMYITLEAVFDVINKYVIPKDGSGFKLMELSTQTEGYTGTAEDLLCVAHPIQVSVDPTVCIIKSPLWYETGPTGVLSGISAAAAANPLQKKADDIKKAATDYATLYDPTKVADNQNRYLVFEAAIKNIANITEYQQINTLLGSSDIPSYLSKEYTSGGVMGLQKSVYLPLQDHLDTTLGLDITVDINLASSKTNKIVPVIPTGTPPPPAITVSVSSIDNAKAALLELKGLQKDFFYNGDPYSELGYIGNIYVNLDFLYRLSLDPNLESSDNKEKNEINLYKYVKNLMAAIQPSIGNINSFEVHVDPVDNKARVIDINFTGDKAPKLFELQVGNLNSVVRNYSLQSQIFPEQSSIIAIGSQAQGGQLGMQNNTMIDFNKNLTDRIIEKKDFGITSVGNSSLHGSSVINTALASNLGGIIFMFSTLQQTTTAPGSGTDISTLFTRCKSNLRDLIVYFQSITLSPGANRNIIPFKFSFEMDGIGGLVIGNLFTINSDVLPNGYKGGTVGVKLAQTITGISHTVGSSDWTTKIDALNIVLGKGPNTIAFSSLKLATLIEESFKNSLQSAAAIAAATPPGGGGGGGCTQTYRGYIPQRASQSTTVKNEYIPALQRKFPSFSTGLKLLMAAQTQQEGFFAGSISYTSNNPGNVGTHTGHLYRVTTFPTLEDGVEAQWTKVLKGAYANTSRYYRSNMTLYDYLHQYAPPCDNAGNPSTNDPTVYTNFVINYFATVGGITITATTTLDQIKAIP
jgi:hypothetical protein